VYASRSGYVKRVTLSPFGYGKMLILSHNDEYQTVYAHLESFEKKLNDFVRSLQLKNLKQSVNYFFDTDTFYYKKGELIGYSGKSGSGAPHLHFEIRNKEGEQINPLLFPKIRDALIDTLAPSFLEVKLVPIGANSRIDFSAKEKSIYNFFDNPRYVSAYTHIDGKAGLLVKINDSNSNNGRDRLAIKKLSLAIDSKDNIIFSKNYTSLDLQNSRSVFLTRDLIQYSINENLFFKLFDELGLEKSENGIINSENLSEGFHTVYVTAEDFYENTATILFNIYSTKTIPTTSMNSNATHIRFTSNEMIEKFEYWMYDKKWKLLFSESLADLNTKEINIPNKKFVGLFAKIKYQNYPNTQTLLFTSNGSIIEDVPDFRLKNYYNSVVFEINSSSFIGNKSNLLCITGTDTFSFPIHYNSPKKYFALIEPHEKLHGRVSFFISQNGQKVHITNSNLIYISNESLSIKTYDGLYEINFPQNSFYNPIFVKIGYVNGKIIFEPKNILLKNPINIIRNTPFKKNERFFIQTKDGWKDIITSKTGNNPKAEIKNQLYDITYAQDIT
ncbi:MAG: M23 family metallopeptidase, partial [Ignavibacteria bacterium]|nr:M23 family metallopeptidase [Ignavibacteria bacterium]